MTDCFNCANFDEGEGKCRFYVLVCSFDLNADCEEYEPLNVDKEVANEQAAEEEKRKVCRLRVAIV